MIKARGHIFINCLFTFWICFIIFALDVSGKEKMIPLPEPQEAGTISVEKAINSRRTCRDFDARPLALKDISQILWAGQGITDKKRFLRTAPSGGALYPLDLYLVTGKDSVPGLEEGVFHYIPERQGLKKVDKGDFRKAVALASLGQMWMAEAPVSLVITSEYDRIKGKYGSRGQRYALIEAGHVGQNIFLQAGALGMAAGIVGAFDDNRVVKTLSLPDSHRPLLIMPVGYAQ